MVERLHWGKDSQFLVSDDDDDDGDGDDDDDDDDNDNGDDDQVVKQEVFSGEYLPKCLRQWQEKSKREPCSKDEEGRLYNVFKTVTEI